MNAAVFHQAVADGDATRVKFLINIGQQARVNQVNKQGYTALQQSSRDGKIDVVHVLLNHGANSSFTGKKGRTALHLAAANGHIDIVELLISSCADLSIKDSEGNLPVDVAKTEQIAELLSAAEAEKKAKSAEANKKCNSEEWGQNVKGLPAGSRNSLVSNSSSDSGVYTEDHTTNTRLDWRLSGGSSKNGAGNRGVVCDNRPMGVLNEGEEVHERSSFTAQTTVNPPRPKLRRSMSERLPAHRRKRSLGRRDLSEELSALNLSRVCSQGRSEVTSEHYNVDDTDLRDCDNNYNGYSPTDSPNDDLDYNVRIREDNDQSGRSSVRKYLENDLGSLPRDRHNAVVCYADKDEGWEDDELIEVPPVPPRRIPNELQESVRKGWDEVDLYRRSNPGNSRSARRRTVDTCEISHEKSAYVQYVNAAEHIRDYSNSGQLRNIADNRRPHDSSVDETIDYYLPFNSKSYAYQRNPSNNLARKFSSCSDTEVGKYYRRLKKLSELNEIHYPYQHPSLPVSDYCDFSNFYRDDCNNLPGYEETLRRIRNERARRPASRQISQV